MFSQREQILIHLDLPCWWRNVWVMIEFNTSSSSSSECVGYDERWHRWIERFIEVYHAAHSATVPALLLPIEVFASGRSSTLWCITWWWIWCWCSIIWCGPVSNGAGAQRGAFLEQHFAPSVPLPSSPGHLIVFHTTRHLSFLRFPL